MMMQLTDGDGDDDDDDAGRQMMMMLADATAKREKREKMSKLCDSMVTALVLVPRPLFSLLVVSYFYCPVVA